MVSEENLAIDMRGISKSFGVVKALADADLRVARGSIHGLVGQNGAGKSTIIKVLAGILKPDAGTGKRRAAGRPFYPSGSASGADRDGCRSDLPAPRAEDRSFRQSSGNGAARIGAASAVF
jgi:ABC-type sugar transport system ATPase subunit